MAAGVRALLSMRGLSEFFGWVASRGAYYREGPAEASTSILSYPLAGDKPAQLVSPEAYTAATAKPLDLPIDPFTTPCGNLPFPPKRP
jgi:hypothetical protein